MDVKKIDALKQGFSQSGGILRTAQMRKLNFSARNIQSLVNGGQIICLKEGYYAWAETVNDLSDNAIAAATIPDAVVCFISAASLYGLTTIIPDSVCIAVPNRGRLPQPPDHIPIRFFSFTPGIYNLGKKTIQDGSREIPVYDRERTVCDCARHDDLIGTDAMLEILRNYMQGKKNIQRLYEYAQKLRVLNKIHPYVEALS